MTLHDWRREQTALRSLPLLSQGRSHKRASPGGHCIWFDTRLRAEDLDDKASSLRLKCIDEGDHFMWRSAGVDPVALVTWRKGVIDQQSFRFYRN